MISKARYRKDIIDVIEDCLYEFDINKGIRKWYIGIEGKWNMVLIKTPNSEDLGGRFADEKKLLPFYGAKEISLDSLNTK